MEEITIAKGGETGVTMNEDINSNNNDHHQLDTANITSPDNLSIKNKVAHEDGLDQDATTSTNATRSASDQLQILTDRALHFLSHASNETIGACLVGLGATTYLVLGRVGLLLIGIIGGVALHASWDAYGQSDKVAAREKEREKRRELGLEVVQRIFAWKDEKSFDGDDDIGGDTAQESPQVRAVAKKKLDFTAFRPKTAVALGSFTDAIIRDYVKYAYPFFVVV